MIISIQIEGMMCPMCEKHMKEALLKEFGCDVLLVSHTEKIAKIKVPSSIPKEELKRVVALADFTFLGSSEEAETA